MHTNRIFTVEASDTGQRLDKFLASKMPEFSRSEIQKFNIVKQNGSGSSALKLSEKLKGGEVFSVEVPNNFDKPETLVASSDFDLDILHEDDDIIVVNKPRGIVMYPAAGNSRGTLVQNILSHTKLSTLGGGSRPGIVHRLDKDTSGIVVLAKSDTAFRELVKTFAAHDLTRKYIAFVWGVPNWESADITGNIARSSRNRQKMTIVKAGGKEAHTEIDVVNVWNTEKISEFKCTLLTGRTHQIRVHLSAHGFPVLCDPVYGRGTSRLGGVKSPELLDFLKSHSGQLLHAAVLEFRHPVTGDDMHFKKRLPADMQMVKDILNYST